MAQSAFAGQRGPWNRGSVAVVPACAKITELADLWCRMDAHEGQAAWAQAIFSVLAILAAGAFPYVEQRRKRAVYRRSFANLVRLAYANMCSTMAGAHRGEYRTALLEGARDDIATSISDLRAFPLHELEAPMLVGSLRYLTTGLEASLEVAEQMLRMGEVGDYSNLAGRADRITVNALPHLRRILLDLGVGLGPVPAGDVANPWPDRG
jgi:hypothetical protein